VTGTSYGIIAPLANGLTMIVDSGEFDARRWYRTLAEHGVTVWYTAPTALRMLARAGEALTREQDLSKLRFVASVDEPLNPEVVVWGQETLGYGTTSALIYLKVDDVHATIESLRADGVEIVTEPYVFSATPTTVWDRPARTSGCRSSEIQSATCSVC
jgi:uncharacterized glyoxalase superfamily protein PhnB